MDKLAIDIKGWDALDTERIDLIWHYSAVNRGVTDPTVHESDAV
jgi:hypothetical protein